MIWGPSHWPKVVTRKISGWPECSYKERGTQGWMNGGIYMQVSWVSPAPVQALKQMLAAMTSNLVPFVILITRYLILNIWSCQHQWQPHSLYDLPWPPMIVWYYQAVHLQKTKNKKQWLSNITKQHVCSWPTPSALCLKKPPSPQYQLAPGDLLNLFFSTFGAADTPVKNLLHIHEKCNMFKTKDILRKISNDTHPLKTILTLPLTGWTLLKDQFDQICYNQNDWYC